MENKCVSCGMPMLSADDHAAGDEFKDYCLYCANPDGSMKSYDEALASMTEFMMHTRNLDEATARTAAAEELSHMPAWRDR